MSKRPSLGSDPLDALFSTPAAKPNTPAKPAPAGKRARSRKADAPAAEQPGARSRKAKATYLLPVELIEEARDAAVALAGPPARLTLAAIVANALRRELDELKRTYNRGKPFPRATGPLVGGRPIGS